MEAQESIEEVQGHLRLALPLMSKHNIPITPRNYTIWYKYVSGADSELSRTIDSMQEKGEAFSEEKNQTLFMRFCAGKDGDELRKIQKDLQQILVSILKEVTELTGQTQDYESFISNSVNMLKEDASIQEIKSVINEISEKTKTLGKFGKTIQDKLQETTEALEKLKKDFEQVKTEAIMDFLTGVPNRKAFEDTLTSCFDEAASTGSDLSLLLIDIDRFKRFNDEHGHLIGDHVLKFVASKIREIVKGRDFLARFGGEEFALILPETPLAGAKVVAESIRSFFTKTKLKIVATSKDLGVLTVSIGVACYRREDTLETFLNRSDRALYFAKSTGRNRVVTENELVSDRNTGHPISPCQEKFRF